MISFACSCGKQYTVADDIGGREVKCSHCLQTLRIPGQTQKESTAADEEATLISPANLDDRTEYSTSRSTSEAWKQLPLPDREVDGKWVRQDLKASDISHGGTFLIILTTAFVLLCVGYVFFDKFGSLVSGNIALMTQGIDSGRRLEADWDSEKEEDSSPLKVKTVYNKPVRSVKTVFPSKSSEKEQEGRDAQSIVPVSFASGNLPKKNAENHDILYRIESDSSDTLWLSWPSATVTGAECFPDEGRGGELCFSLFFSEDANKAFELEQPEGFDQAVEFSDIRIRLSAETGFVDFVPTGKKQLVQWIEQSRREWAPIRIPLQGDANWTRVDHGLIGWPVFKRIELFLKPTGNGLVFWIDHPEIVP